MSIVMINIGRTNDQSRQRWLSARLSSLPQGIRILDAGAGELRNKSLCAHLRYVSQDFCQYQGTGDGVGMQTGEWDVSRIDIVCDISSIPEPNGSFDAILCSEVFEHLADPVPAVKEFSRLLKPDGIIILTAPFCSLTHFAPYHFASGFNRYWYEHHLAAHGFEIEEMTCNGNWFEYIAQELWRLRYMGRNYSSRFGGWLAFIFALPVLGMLAYLNLKQKKDSGELLNHGWHVLARRRAGESND